jgi:hypothetical protein
MMPQKRRNSRGSVMLEFTLAGIAAVTILITTVQLCIGMWNYHTIAYSVHEATRYAASHGRGCITGTSSCGITIADITSKLIADSIGVRSSALSVTLTTDSGASTTCNPVTSCSSNTTRWPPTSNMDNTTGKKVTVSASYTFTSAMLIFWPGTSAQRLGTFTLPASSTEAIVF